MHSAQCAVCNVHCTTWPGQCAHSICFAEHKVRYVPRTLYSNLQCAKCKVSDAEYTLCRMHNVLCFYAQCTVCSVQNAMCRCNLHSTQHMMQRAENTNDHLDWGALNTVVAELLLGTAAQTHYRVALGPTNSAQLTRGLNEPALTEFWVWQKRALLSGTWYGGKKPHMGDVLCKS